MSLRDANSKLETAQETIRKLLAEKHGGDKSMVDLGVASSGVKIQGHDQGFHSCMIIGE